MWVVTKPFDFQLVVKDSGSMCGKIAFDKGQEITGFHREVCTLDNSTILVIELYTFTTRSYEGVNFNIEDYVEEVDNNEQYMDRVSRDSETTKTVHLQIKLLNTEADVNEFLMTIPKERVIGIKKISYAPNDSRFMVIYTEEK